MPCVFRQLAANKPGACVRACVRVNPRHSAQHRDRWTAYPRRDELVWSTNKLISKSEETTIYYGKTNGIEKWTDAKDNHREVQVAAGVPALRPAQRRPGSVHGLSPSAQRVSCLGPDLLWRRGISCSFLCITRSLSASFYQL